ncbi:MAG: two-component system phosphate regulon sensor histidine kinase PhoR [Cellvibrionaceae bacterium]|jgi:two-component system phosphate regulon sensor histidine kinase PhoR
MLTQTRLPLSQRLANVTEILISFASSSVPSLFFQTLADYTRFAIHYDFFGIALTNPDGSAFVIHPLDSKIDDTLPAFDYELLDSGLIGNAILSGRLTSKHTLLDDDTNDQFEQLCKKYNLSNQLIIPLKQGDQKIGALVLAAEASSVYNKEDEQIGVLISSGLSANFEMARLYQTLADERSTLSSLLESTKDGFFVISPEATVLIANPAFLEMFHIKENVVGKAMFEVFEKGPFLELFDNDKAAVAEIPLDDGRIVQANRHAVISGFGEHLGWAIVLHDITLLKELVEMKTDFVNTVAHDLKNPLASIRMAADLIPKLGETNAAQKDMHERIVRTSSYMRELVTELLDIGQLESNLGLNIRTLDLVTELGDVIFALKTNSEVKQIKVDSTFPDSQKIDGDSGRLRQLFLNLVGNAIKYTPENGHVWITVLQSPGQTQDQKIEITVRDDGLGIPADDLPRIFDKFYRVRTENRAKIKGTGLGLAITKSIVEAHGGEISVESEELKGTLFRVVLPLVQPRQILKQTK